MQSNNKSVMLSNLKMLEFVAAKLGEIRDDVVFLGGCTTGLFITDPEFPDVRYTLFSCKVIGDVLLDAANENPLLDFLVLCGHTHSESNYQPLSNLRIRAGRAEYRYPQIQEVILL